MLSREVLAAVSALLELKKSDATENGAVVATDVTPPAKDAATATAGLEAVVNTLRVIAASAFGSPRLQLGSDDGVVVRSPSGATPAPVWTAYVVHREMSPRFVDPWFGLVFCAAADTSSGTSWFVTDPAGRFAQVIVFQNKFVCVADAARCTIWVMRLPLSPTLPPILLGGVSTLPAAHFANFVGICALPVSSADALSSADDTFHLVSAQSVDATSTLLRVFAVHVDPRSTAVTDSATAATGTCLGVRQTAVFSVDVASAANLTSILSSTLEMLIGVADRARACVAVYTVTGEPRGCFYAAVRERRLVPVAATQLLDGRVAIVTDSGHVAFCDGEVRTPLLILMLKDKIGAIRTIQPIGSGADAATILTIMDGSSYRLAQRPRALHYPSRDFKSVKGVTGDKTLLREPECEKVTTAV